MHIVVVGLNYRTAPVEVRERFALAEEQLAGALTALKATMSIMECVIIATCNRTEIYAVVERPQICGHDVRWFMENWFGLPRAQFTSYLYMYEDHRAIEHLFKVASGLDSMIIGETQILGQVRDAFLEAQNLKTTGTIFNMLFKQAITLAKRAHSETKIGELAVSVSYAAVELGKHIFGSFNNKNVVVLGAGETGELTAKHLHGNGASKISVVNRTLEKAQEVAASFGGFAYTFDQAKAAMEQADIMISSTAAKQYILTAEDVQRIMDKRRNRPLFMIDIAVPRDFDPRIAELDNVYLYDIDDLKDIVESNLAQRKQEAVKIEAMIAEEIKQFESWYQTLGVVPLIRALHSKAEQVHAATMVSLTNKLPNLSEQELKVIRKLTKSMVNQMIQEPVVRIKELAGEKKADEAMALFTQLFDLEQELALLAEENDKKEAQSTAVQERNSLVRSAKKLAALVRS
ncbi:glutamyl-tRNA reductase [Paenibacillus montaniterrae]|uniref:Glutamyl-tRNA reductase n=1 Tax=Paenibacillus montaniterrae TaxID=429341 RepID=A0A919YRC0_9BACL|nr:glutamyl-tRNA reductase [Paenibacillus montaniterrae]GIP16936.1 glutamyl-tRNA reductase [Paenibacillus montaniterrae]